jgi:hypothetical protein
MHRKVLFGMIRTASFFSFSLGFLCLKTEAQVPTPEKPETVAKPVPSNLNDTLDRVKKVGITLPPPPPRGYNLNEALKAFAYQPLRTQSVTAVAPAMMRVFARPIMSPEKAALLSKEALATALFATFSPQQWQLLGSKNGIGMGDLNPKQQEFYAAFLPEGGYLSNSKSVNCDFVSPNCQTFRISLWAKKTLLMDLVARIKTTLTFLFVAVAIIIVT